MLLVLALLLPLYSIAEDCPKYENMKWTPADRQGILKVHNELRKKIREGNFVAGNGKDKKAAAKEGTMPDLKYDCKLEESAQKWADTCPTKTEDGLEEKGLAQNIGWIGGEQQLAGIGEKVSLFWAESLLKNRWPCNLMKPELWENGGIQSKTTLGTTMAWSKTTQIGCGVKLCPTETGHEQYTVICNYSPRGNILGEVVYETADGVQPPCPSASSAAEDDQSPPASSPPSTEPEKTESSTTASTADDVDCPPYEHMAWTPDDRRAILKVHNLMRKKIREGNYVVGNGKTYPFHRKAAAKPGTLPDLKYNCTLEMGTQKWLMTCPKHHQPGVGENGWGSKPANSTFPDSFSGRGEEASRAWESEFEHRGWPCNVMGVELEDIGHAAQMAWSHTTDVGCGAWFCNGWVGVACAYMPPGNYPGEYMYETDGEQPTCPPLGPSTSSPSSPSSIQLPLFCLLAVALLSDLFSDRATLQIL